MTLDFILGVTLGAGAYAVLMGLLSTRFGCRVGWHKWGLWTLAANGGGQSRICSKCGLWSVRRFDNFTVELVKQDATKDRA